MRDSKYRLSFQGQKLNLKCKKTKYEFGHGSLDKFMNVCMFFNNFLGALQASDISNQPFASGLAFPSKQWQPIHTLMKASLPTDALVINKLCHILHRFNALLSLVIKCGVTKVLFLFYYTSVAVLWVWCIRRTGVHTYFTHPCYVKLCNINPSQKGFFIGIFWKMC